MMKFSSIMAIMFAFLTVAAGYVTFSYSSENKGKEMDYSTIIFSVSAIIVFAILTLVFWRKSAADKNKES